MKEILIDLKKCLSCKSCEIACTVSHSNSGSIFGAVLEEKKSRPRIHVEAGEGASFPLQCRQCEDPKCVQACISGAMSKDTSTGLVVSNPDKCIGCWMCVMVCPFGAIAQDREDKSAVKCDRCAGLEEPACVRACPTRAIKFAEIDEFCKSTRKEYLSNFQFSEEGK